MSTKRRRHGQNKWSSGDPVPETDSRSIVHFFHLCGIWNFRRFTGISHTVTVRFLRYLVKWLKPTRKWINFGIDPADIRIQINAESGFESRMRFWPWRSMRCPSATIGTVVSQFPVLSRRQKVSLMQRLRLSPVSVAGQIYSGRRSNYYYYYY